jgi:hypothetical protein
MLTIHEGFPMKKMAMFGTAAFIIGFTGTLMMLREYIPKDESGNISVVHPSNKQEAKTSVSNQVPKKTDASKQDTTSDAVAPLAQSTPVASGGTLSTRQATPTPLTPTSGTTAGGGAMTVAPAPTPTPSPVVGSASQPSAGVGGGSSSQPAPATTQPITVVPLPSTPNLQNTLNGVTGAVNPLQ